MFAFLIIAGILALAFGLFTFQSVLLRKLGGVCVLVASYLSGFFLSGNVWVGAAFAAAWLFVPWLEILGRIRHLRLPLDKKLRYRRPPSRAVFPGLAEFTKEVEESGFVFIEDTGWDWDDMNQFVRGFYHGEKRAEASITFCEQEGIAYAYLSLKSRLQDGTVWMTWNYPFAPTMKLAPELRENRMTNAVTFEEMVEGHEWFLHNHGLTIEDCKDPLSQDFPATVQNDIRQQIDHNLNVGLIKLSGEGTFRYSWRGMFYLWFQFLKDMLKIS